MPWEFLHIFHHIYDKNDKKQNYENYKKYIEKISVEKNSRKTRVSMCASTFSLSRRHKSDIVKQHAIILRLSKSFPRIFRNVLYLDVKKYFEDVIFLFDKGKIYHGIMENERGER